MQFLPGRPRALRLATAAAAAAAAAAYLLARRRRRRRDAHTPFTGSAHAHHAIGTVSSPLARCVGSPRQASLAPNAVASIQLDPRISPTAFDGLEEYSHVWCVWVFHANTNAAKVSKAWGDATNGTTFAGKVRPPMLAGKRLGVFATRSPHRPNPIGLSLLKLESVDAKRRLLHVSGCDMIDGTPVLDIKPYVGAYDAPPHGIRSWVPAWLQAAVAVRRDVHFAAPADADLRALPDAALRQYRTRDRLRAAVADTLAVDARSQKELKQLEGGRAVFQTFGAVKVEFSQAPETGARTVLAFAFVAPPKAAAAAVAEPAGLGERLRGLVGGGKARSNSQQKPEGGKVRLWYGSAARLWSSGMSSGGRLGRDGGGGPERSRRF